MKKIISLIIAVLLCCVIVNAIEPLPKGPCIWTRPSTEYRPERNFTGVYGRFSDGSIRCFSPGSSYSPLFSGGGGNVEPNQPPSPPPVNPPCKCCHKHWWRK